MASTVLPNGIIIPEKYSRDWYADLYHNWQELDNLLGGGTPKDGTLTIQKNGSTVGTFSANQATNETVNIEVPTVNNATLTIQQNGTTVDTFTANSSTDKTVDITVPTKTSDLTNDSGFITSDNTKIPLAGSNQISGSLIPATTDAYDLGGSSYQWNNAYIKSLTINGVACGDILTHNVSEFVDVAGDQTIGGIKTFSNIPIVDIGKTYVSKIKANRTDGTQTGFSAYNGFKIVCDNDSQGWDNTAFAIHISEYSPTRATIAFKLYDCIEGSVSYKGFVFSKNNNDFQLSPTASNAINLGTSTNKWKSFNGINPGALSLPSISSTGANAWIVLDTTDWVKNIAVSLAQKYTPLADGWLNVRVDNATMLAIAVGGNYMHQMIRSETANSLALLMPVFKNTEVAIMVGGNENLAYNRVTFYYCQGNV